MPKRIMTTSRDTCFPFTTNDWNTVIRFQVATAVWQVSLTSTKFPVTYIKLDISTAFYHSSRTGMRTTSFLNVTIYIAYL